MKRIRAFRWESGMLMTAGTKYVFMSGLLAGAFTCNIALAAQAIQEQDDIVAERFEQSDGSKVLEIQQESDEDNATDQQKIFISDLKIQDVDIRATQKSDIAEILSKYKNKSISINELNVCVREINSYLRENGYPAATAYLPAQESKNHEIVINLELGKFGKIILENNSTLSETIINRLLSNIKTGEKVSGRILETAIYNINELGGVQAAGFFRPGKNVGETDIVIRIADIKKDAYSVYAENYGSDSSGRYRYNVNASWYNLLNAGDRISVNGMMSNQKQHNYGIQYEQLIAKNGTKANISIGRSDYELGSRYSSMGATGISSNIGINFSTPLWKTSKSRMSLNYGFTHRNLKDEMRDFCYVVEKHSDTAFIGINGSEVVGKTGLNYDISVFSGNLTADKAEVSGIPLKISTEGRFTKAVLNLSAQHRINKFFDFRVRGQAQKASNLLDSSEQFFLGGARGVRAYPQGEGSGDEGYQMTGELVYNTKIKGLAFSTFYDLGHVIYSKDSAMSGGTTLQGWGVGVSYSKGNCWAKLEYARRIGLGNNATEAAKAKQRVWFMVGMQW